MDEQKNGIVKTIVMGIVIFGVGMMFGAAGASTSTPAECPDQPACEVCEACPTPGHTAVYWQGKLQELKELDDNLIYTSSRGHLVCGEALTAAGNFDPDGIEAATAKLPALQSQLEELSAQRAELIVEVGL